ncbi:hypothetical protein [Gloeocapsopsis crepidinum]|nr:hypothetical protein [Gloeocapsopsis crepidinum]
MKFHFHDAAIPIAVIFLLSLHNSRLVSGLFAVTRNAKRFE